MSFNLFNNNYFPLIVMSIRGKEGSSKMAVVRNKYSRKRIDNRRREKAAETTSETLLDKNNLSAKEIVNFDIETVKFRKSPKFTDGEEYDAVTTDAFGLENDDGSRALIVEAEAMNELGRKHKFSKYIKVENEEGSFLHRFCENMDAISPEGTIVLQSLIGKDVVITLYTNSKGKTYISTIFPVDSVDDSIGEEEDYYSYDNDFSYNDGEDGDCIYED